jgi:hypothetical protein
LERGKHRHKPKKERGKHLNAPRGKRSKEGRDLSAVGKSQTPESAMSQEVVGGGFAWKEAKRCFKIDTASQ